MKISLTCAAAILLASAFTHSSSALAFQGPSGQVEDIKTPKVNQLRRRPPPPPCARGTIKVSCAIPDCQIWLDGKIYGTADKSGAKSLDVVAGRHTLVVGRIPEFESTEPQSVMVGCGMSRNFPVTLKRRGVLLRIRTEPSGCEINVDEGNGMRPAGRSGADGVATYHTLSTSFLIEVRRQGFFPRSETIHLERGKPDQEISLKLRPVPASLTISANVQGAQAQVDGESRWFPLESPLLLSPGRHQISVEALGHEPFPFEVVVGPGGVDAKTVVLRRSPVQDLVAAAETKYGERAYADVLTLCQYVFEASPQHPRAHLFAGIAYLGLQDYARAESHLMSALSGGESIRFRVRRHPREVFDVAKGHDSCEAILTLGKDGVEFQGIQYPADNFHVAYGQIQIAGLRLKKKSALYLSTKVLIQQKKKKVEYNFFSYEGELSQWGRPYLTLLQHLLQSR